MRPVLGTDISFYQDEPSTPQGVNFNTMRSLADFVIVRAGQNLWVDSRFPYHWSESKKAGMARGSYWFYDSRADPKRQAELWVKTLGNDLGELPLWADFEEKYGGTYKGWQNWYVFLERLKALVGQKEIGIYTAYYYWRDNAPNPTTQAASLAYFRRYPLWLAHYNAQAPMIPKPWTENEWVFWQYTDKGDGKQYGVESKQIDLNYFNGDIEAFKTRFGLTGSTPITSQFRVDLSVREGPAPTFNALTTLSQDDIVERLSVSDDGNWTQIQRQSDQLQGWISNNFLVAIPAESPDPDPEEPVDPTPPIGTGRMYRVTATSLRLRSGPSLTSSIIGGLSLNEMIEELSLNPDRTWMQVRNADGLAGWCATEYLVAVPGTPPTDPTPEEPVDPTPVDPVDPQPPAGTERMYRVNVATLRVRSGPGTQFGVIGGLLLNEFVEELAATDDKVWMQVRNVNGLVGWCVAEYLVSVDAVPAHPLLSEYPWYRVTATSLLVREGPGTTFKTIGNLVKEDVVAGVGNETSGWVKITRFDGLVGWCSLSFLTSLGVTPPKSIRQRLFIGATYFRREYSTPRNMVLHVLGLDLSAAKYSFFVTPESRTGGLSCTRITSRFLSEFNQNIAINGDGFTYLPPDPANSCSFGEPVKVNGYAASQGKIYNTKSAATLYANVNNEVTIGTPKGSIYNAISGDRIVLSAGKRIADLAVGVPEPRTAIGLTSNGRGMLLMVVDGRQPGYSEGATLHELVDMLISFGAYNGINMDGGGSSSLVVKGIDSQPRILNRPINANTAGQERPIANHFGVTIKV